MRRLFLPLFILASFAAGTASAQAQTLIHAYAFNGNLNDSIGSTPLTYSNSPSLAGSGPGSLTTTSGYYTFGLGQGLGFLGTSSLSTDYSIAMRFSFTTTDGYQRMIDFSNLTSDIGMYTLGTAFRFYPVVSGGTITANTSVDFILTRSSTNSTVIGYAGTTEVFRFTDTSNYAVASLVSGQASFGFFRDDGGENASGRIDTLLIYNGALSAGVIGSGAIGEALTAVPEPATTVAWSGAAGLAVALAWRRRRRTAD